MEKMPKNAENFICKECHFVCCKKSNFDKHVLTSKHKNRTILNVLERKMPKNAEKIFQCECGKKYSVRNSLWYHKQKCKILNNFETEEYDNKKAGDSSDKDNLIMILIKQNTELIKETTDFKNMMMKVIENGTHNTTNNTINNNFNLQFFLNETCKNALNIDDFVSSIKVSLTELENTGRRGYIEGISTIIINELNKLSHCDRPIHCSDNKRETMYIKNENQWFKETEEKPILKKAIKIIANENIKQINTWRQQNPDCTEADSNKNNLYLQIVSNSMSGSTKEESDKNYEKIISNIAKQVIIDK